MCVPFPPRVLGETRLEYSFQGVCLIYNPCDTELYGMCVRLLGRRDDFLSCVSVKFDDLIVATV